MSNLNHDRQLLAQYARAAGWDKRKRPNQLFREVLRDHAYGHMIGWFIRCGEKALACGSPAEYRAAVAEDEAKMEALDPTGTLTLQAMEVESFYRAASVLPGMMGHYLGENLKDWVIKISSDRYPDVAGYRFPWPVHVVRSKWYVGYRGLNGSVSSAPQFLILPQESAR